MAELTPQDEKNYDDLKNSFLQRNTEKDRDTTIKKILESVKLEPQPKNTSELRQTIDKLELYLKILDLLEVELFKAKFAPPGDKEQEKKNKEEKEKLEQQFSDSIENLKRSLKVVEAPKVDLTGEIEEFQPDSLFLDFIKDTTPSDANPKKWTETLIDDRNPNLRKQQIDRLIQAWGIAVNSFVEDARKRNEKKNGQDDKVTPLQPETFAHFFRIHKELEVLYSRLADTDTAQKIR